MRRRAPVHPGPGAPAEAGVTLIELLVVLALMGVLLGLGMGMYANLGKQGVFTATTGRVLSTINRVRNSSMTHPAALQVNAGDPAKGEENSVQGIEFLPMVQTQCEPPAPNTDWIAGAMDRNGTLPPGVEFKDGVIGKGMFLSGSAVSFGNHAAYDATRGINLDLSIFPTVATSGTLIHRGPSLDLSTTRQEGGVGVKLVLGFAAGDQKVEGAKPGSVVMETREFSTKDTVIPLNKWSRIVVTYDMANVVIAVDLGRGPVERLRVKENSPLAPSSRDELFLGGGGGAGRTFKGGIDDVRLEGVLGADYEPFPPQVLVDGKSRRIYFLNGKLDPTRHSRAESLVLLFGRRKKEIVIGLEGNIVQK